ncbi:MAG: glycosyltransferase family 4 protein [Promethearchaeota archaeon]
MLANNKRKKIKICHIVLLADLSGSKRSMLEILNRCDKNTYKRYVISNGKGELIHNLNKLGINSLSIPQLVRKISPVLDIIAFFRIYKYCKKYKFDIVHTHSSKTGLLGRVAAKLSGVKKIIHHVRGYSFHEFSSLPNKLIYGILEKFASYFCDKVIFVNEEEKNYSIEKHILPEYKCITILNGIDLKKFNIRNKKKWKQEVRRHLNIPLKSKVIMFAGRLCPQKDPITLKETIISFYNHGNNNTYFLILGNGEYYNYLLNEFKKYLLSSKVIMLGWKNNTEKYLAASDIFFLPSLWEGMPLTILEAMAMGVPIVASDIKGNREAVDPNNTGFLIAPKSPYLFCKKLHNLIENDSLRKIFGLNAYNRAIQYFDIDKNVKKILNLYKLND